MKTSPNGRKLIESFEGLILQSYDDYNDHIVKEGDTVHGTLTIGYGHTSAAGSPHVALGMRITQEEADAILAEDLSKVEQEISHLVQVPLTQNQYDALVSFHFNTGALGHSSILTSLNEKDYSTAADRLLLYDKRHIGDKIITVAGLQRRRQAERTLFLKSDEIVPTTTTPSTWNIFVDTIITTISKLFKRN